MTLNDNTSEENRASFSYHYQAIDLHMLHDLVNFCGHCQVSRLLFWEQTGATIFRYVVSTGPRRKRTPHPGTTAQQGDHNPCPNTAG
jgi:hypothetical protein